MGKRKFPEEYKGINFESIEEERQFFKVSMRRQNKMLRSYRNSMYDVRNLLLPHVVLPPNWHCDNDPDVLAFGSPIERAERAISEAKDRYHNSDTLNDVRSTLLEVVINWLIDFNRSK